MAAHLAIHGNFPNGKVGKRQPAKPKNLPQPVGGLKTSLSEPVIGQVHPSPQLLKLPGLVQLRSSSSVPEFPHGAGRAQLFTNPKPLTVQRRRLLGADGNADRLQLPAVERQAPLNLPILQSLHIAGMGRAGIHPAEDNGEGPVRNARPSLLEVGILSDLERSTLEHNMSGPVALAFALIAKFGTLESAWERFDLTRSGKISRWQWDNALSMMHLDTERVCGMSANMLFSQISQGSQVTSDAWAGFFKAFVEDSSTSSALQEALRHFEKNREEDRRAQADRQGDRTHREKTHVRASGHAASSLKEAVEKEGRMSKEELAEVELQASAENLQLQEELQKLNLEGDLALAYILTAKFGSLRKAFKWFNSNNSGRMSNNEWDTGIRIMRVDVHRLTGCSSQSYFKQMHQGHNIVRQSDWNAFFQSVMENAPAGFDDILAAAAGSAQKSSLAERARLKKEELRKARANQMEEGADQIEDRGKLQEPSSNRTGHHSESDRAAAQATSDRTAHSKGDGRDACGTVCGTHGMPEHEQVGNDSRHGKFGDSLTDDERLAAIRAKLGALSEDEMSFRARILAQLSQLEFGKSAEFFSEHPEHLDERKFLIIEDVAAELNLFAHVLKGGHVWSDGSVEPGGVIVFNLGDFPRETLQQLRAIELHSSFAFPPTLTSEQRQVVHLLGRSIGIWTKSEGRGEARHIIAFNVGDFAAQVREELKALKKGQSKIYPPSLSEAQRKIVHLIATELELTSFSEGAGDSRHVEVFNLASFADEVWSELEQLQSGEQKTFDKSLDRAQRKIIHCISDNLNLAHVSDGVGEERSITVGNLNDFRIWARNELEKLELGSTKAFDVSLSGLQRKIVHELATEFGMSSFSQGVGSERFVSVTRSAEDGCSTSDLHQARRRSCDETEGSQSDDEEDTHDNEALEQVFDQRATGYHNGQKMFTRVDLDHFREEFQEMMPRKKRERLKPILTQVYEDSLQLQLDFGTRIKKGLNYRWFNVFIQKAAAKVGFSAIGLLMSFYEGSL